MHVINIENAQRATGEDDPGDSIVHQVPDVGDASASKAVAKRAPKPAAKG